MTDILLLHSVRGLREAGLLRQRVTGFLDRLATPERTSA
jgi:hypothetical protein